MKFTDQIFQWLAYALFITALPAASLSASVQGDMNLDGNIDFIIFNPVTRTTQIDLLHGTTFVSKQAGRTLPGGMRLVGIADLNGDGIMDYVMVSSDRKIVYGLRAGDGSITTKLGPVLPTGYEVAAAADMNRDGRMDFILFNSQYRTTRYMLMNSVNPTSGSVAAIQTVTAIASVDAGYKLVGVADFDRDGIPDLVFACPNRGTLVMFMKGTYGNGLRAVAVAAGGVNGYSVVGVGDFNHDHVPDLVLTNSYGAGRTYQSQFLFLKLTTNSAKTSFALTNLGAFVAGTWLPAGGTLVFP